LAKAAAISGRPELRAAAMEAFDRRYEYATGEEIVERWFGLRRHPALIGFEAAAAIRAALAVGQVDKAREVAQAAVATSPRWAEGTDVNGWLTTSRGALLEALSQLGGFEQAAQDLMHHLVLTQGRGGSWSLRNTQATAYAVRGLFAHGDEAAQAAAQKGHRWLKLTQLQDGTWATFNDLLPEPFVGDQVHEVTAEALLALSPRGAAR
jgi:hypothetical protein